MRPPVGWTSGITAASLTLKQSNCKVCALCIYNITVMAVQKSILNAALIALQLASWPTWPWATSARYSCSLMVFETSLLLVTHIKSPRATWTPSTQICNLQNCYCTSVTVLKISFRISMQSALRLGHLFLFLLLCFLLHEGIGLEQIHFLSIVFWKHENY